MQGEFEMSLMGELNYFLGLQIKRLDEGTAVCQTKYCRKLLKRFGINDSKSIDTPMPTNGNLDKDKHVSSYLYYASPWLMRFVLDFIYASQDYINRGNINPFYNSPTAKWLYMLEQMFLLSLILIWLHLLFAYIV